MSIIFCFSKLIREEEIAFFLLICCSQCLATKKSDVVVARHDSEKGKCPIRLDWYAHFNCGLCNIVTLAARSRLGSGVRPCIEKMISSHHMPVVMRRKVLLFSLLKCCKASRPCADIIIAILENQQHSGGVRTSHEAPPPRAHPLTC